MATFFKRLTGGIFSSSAPAIVKEEEVDEDEEKRQLKGLLDASGSGGEFPDLILFDFLLFVLPFSSLSRDCCNGLRCSRTGEGMFANAG